MLCPKLADTTCISLVAKAVDFPGERTQIHRLVEFQCWPYSNELGKVMAKEVDFLGREPRFTGLSRSNVGLTQMNLGK